MPNIIHRFGIEETTKKIVYNSFATIEGLSSWWTNTIEGKSQVGEVIHFIFTNGGPEFEVLRLEPNELVEWKCTSGPPEWIDTHIEFEIKEVEGEVVVLFEHSGWRQEIEFMHHCSTQWAYFLIGLQRKLSGHGPATTYGSENFLSISRWTK